MSELWRRGGSKIWLKPRKPRSSSRPKRETKRRLANWLSAAKVGPGPY